MIQNLKLSMHGLDRTFLNVSSKMTEPFCGIWHLLCFRLVAPLDPQKFENCTTLTKELATRAFIVLGAILGVFITVNHPIASIISIASIGLGSKVLRSIGFILQNDSYTHVRGSALEKTLNPQDPQIKVMAWNICGVGGGLSLDHGGVIDWRSRIDSIVEKIKNEDADVLILEEIYDTALAESLIKRLNANYAHFYIHLGPNTWGSVSGCMVLSKCAVHQFSYTEFTNNKWTLNRGFATLELYSHRPQTLPCVRVIGTHLIHGDESEAKKSRKAQVMQIVNSINQQTLLLPTILAGDLNIERDQEEGALLSTYFHHAYQASEPTCTNRLVSQWNIDAKSVWGETIDYLSIFKSNIPAKKQTLGIENCHLIKAFDETYNTKTALSDHHGISAVFKKL